uniref:Calponin-homology (CH) domain-containing protein n=1 Tax=Panagrellus redivivus TaxID=6233 RepID=A0A7E4VMV3_PANRE
MPIPLFSSCPQEAKTNGERKKRLSTSAAFDTSLWMATEDIVAAAIIFNINIAVFNGSTWKICNLNFVEQKMGKIVEGVPTVLLYNASNLHYEAVLSVSR